MHYYIINNKIIAYTYELDASLYNYDKLSTEQSLFYEQNPNASLSEILTMELKPPVEPTEFEIAKQNKQNEFNLFAYNFISNGYLDTETNYKLFTSEKDILNYATLLNSLQFENDNTSIEFGTMLGWEIDTCLVVKSLLERYSRYCRPLTTKILRLQTEIENAQSLTDLENIII